MLSTPSSGFSPSSPRTPLPSDELTDETRPDSPPASPTTRTTEFVAPEERDYFSTVSSYALGPTIEQDTHDPDADGNEDQHSDGGHSVSGFVTAHEEQHSASRSSSVLDGGSDSDLESEAFDTPSVIVPRRTPTRSPTISRRSSRGTSPSLPSATFLIMCGHRVQRPR